MTVRARAIVRVRLRRGTTVRASENEINSERVREGE